MKQKELLTKRNELIKLLVEAECNGGKEKIIKLLDEYAQCEGYSILVTKNGLLNVIIQYEFKK